MKIIASLFLTTILLISGVSMAGTSYTKPDKQTLKNQLTELQYRVTQNEGTEQPYTNEYWDNKRPGIYVDIVSGEPLFSSTDKYDSKTGWPSFTKPLEPQHIVTREDRKMNLPAASHGVSEEAQLEHFS